MKPFSLVASVFSCLAFAVSGCGGTGDADDSAGNAGNSGNTKLSKPAKEILVGTWTTELELDDDKVAEMLKKRGSKAKEIDPNVLELTKETLREQIGEMKITLKVNADGTSEATAPGRRGKKSTEKSKWEVVSEDGMVVELKLTEPRGTNTAQLTFRSDDEYEFSSDAAKYKQAPFKMPLIFKRQ